VAEGALECLLLARVSESSMDNRIKKILRATSFLREDCFPDDLKNEWRVIRAVHIHKISAMYDHLPVREARIRSLKKKEKEQVLLAFLTITVEVIKRLDDKSKWKRIKHTSI